MYDTEELLMDQEKKQLSGQLIFDDSVKRIWVIRRYIFWNYYGLT